MNDCPDLSDQVTVFANEKAVHWQKPTYSNGVKKQIPSIMAVAIGILIQTSEGFFMLTLV